MGVSSKTALACAGNSGQDQGRDDPGERMPTFYLTLIAVLLAGLGARDQVTLAGVALRQRGRPALLIVALFCACATAALAAGAAAWMLPILPPPARTIFAAIAVALAGVESLLVVPRRPPAEPTHSLGALALVLLARQATDAPRFLILGLGVGMGAPLAAGAGGLLGGAVLVSFAWTSPEFFERRSAGLMRRAAGGVLALVALILFLSEFGIL